MEIPKIIHYCWFGNNPKPELMRKCLQSWKKYMPEYEIMEWNESNFNVNQNSYAAEAYKTQKWAFVSDFARFKVIEQYGGIYFDTDVELLHPIPDGILQHNVFMGVESAGLVNPGLVFGSIPHHYFTLAMLGRYEKEHFLIDGKMNTTTVNERTTEELRKIGYHPSPEENLVEDIVIYPSGIFCGYDQDVREYCITPNTIAVHHYASSWKNTKSLKRKLQNVIKQIIGVEGYRKLLKMKRMIGRVCGAK